MLDNKSLSDHDRVGLVLGAFVLKITHFGFLVSFEGLPEIPRKQVEWMPSVRAYHSSFLEKKHN